MSLDTDHVRGAEDAEEGTVLGKMLQVETSMADLRTWFGSDPRWRVRLLT